jgi:hypothetical protein
MRSSPALPARFLLGILLLLLPSLAFSQSGKKKKELYQQYIKTADSAFALKDYARAKEQYLLASGMKPKEEYPKSRVTECEQKAAVQNAEYRRLVKLADSCFDKKSWEPAKTYYLQAVTVKPTESYAREQAKTCNYNIVARNAMAQNYTKCIRTADSCFASRSWACAKAQYEAALAIKPGEKYPTERLAACNKNMSTAVSAEQYAMLIDEADRKFDAEDYRGAKVKYQDALAVRPNDPYPAKRIALCEEKLQPK